MRLAREVSSWSVVALLAALGAVVPRPAVAASSPDHLEYSLSLLPEVTSHRLDAEGRLTWLEGHLTPAGESPATEVVTGFLTIHADLYQATPGSVLRVEWSAEREAGVEVAVRQHVGEFACDGTVRGLVGPTGVLLRLDGALLSDGDAEALVGRTIGRDEAYRRAGRLVLGREPSAEDLARLPAHAATGLIEAGGRRVWRVELVRRSGRRLIRHQVVLDARTGEAVRRTQTDVTELAGAGPRLQPQPAAPEKVATAIGCEPADPPPGDLTTTVDFEAWTPHCLQTWQQQGQMGAAFETPAEPPECEPGPWVGRSVPVPARHSRVRFHFPTLSARGSFVLGWGLTEADTVELKAPAKIGTPPFFDVTVIVYLDDNERWPPPRGSSSPLRLEMATLGMSGTLDRVDLLPGAYLELADQPRLLAGSQVPPVIMAGTTLDLWQSVVNNGCELRTKGSTAQRGITWSACKDDEPGLCATLFCPASATEPDPEATVKGALAAGAVASYDLCDLVLPPPSAEVEGSWTLVGQPLDLDKSPGVLAFHVDNGVTPNLLFDQVERYPMDAWDVSPQGDWSRLDVVGVGTPFTLVVPLVSENEAAVEVPLQVWARGRMPGGPKDEAAWRLLGQTVVPRVETYGTAVELHQLLVDPGYLPLEGVDWAVLDVKVVVNPDRTVVETEYENDFVVADWIPVVAGTLDDALGTASLLSEDFNGAQQTDFARFAMTVTPDLEDGLAYVKYDWTSNEETPFMAWLRNWGEGAEHHLVGGLMVRYRRVEHCGFQPYLVGGEYCGQRRPESPENLMPPGLGGGLDSRGDLDFGDWQWHTLVWRESAHLPMGWWEGGDTLPILAYPFGPAPRKSIFDEVTETFLGLDTICCHNVGQCVGAPETEVDLIRAWEAEEPSQPFGWDAAPAGLLVACVDGEWRDLASSVGLGETLQLGLRVTLAGEVPQNGLTPGMVSVERGDPSEAAVIMTADVPVSLPGEPNTLVFPLLETWTPEAEGQVAFAAQLSIPGNTQNAGNDSADYVVYAGPCVPALSLP